MPGQMQEGYGCVVANRFDQLLDDENDPFEALIEAAKKKDDGTVRPAKTAAQAAKPPKKEAPKDRKPVPEKKEETQAPVALKKDGMRRMGRRPEGPAGTQPQGEGRPPTERRTDRRPPRERRFERPAGEEKPAGEGGEFSVEKPAGERPFRGRGGGRGGRGGGRGRGIGRDGFDARGKREFDRHSGSDRSLKPEEKRGGSGSHNWGTVKDELSELDQSNVTEEAPEGEEHPPADSENKENEAGEVKEEGPKEMTLDEWKAMQGKDRAKQEFNIRKPNEGADSQWKKGFVLHKSKTEAPAVIDAEAEHEADDEHHSRKPAHDITAQLEINFGDLGRPGRGRGGPRGGRGGRGRGGGREGGREGGRDGEAAGGAPRPARGGRTDRPSGVSVPNVDDPEAFPALA